MRLFEVINKNYNSNDLILLSDLYKLVEDKKAITVRKQLERLVEEKNLQRVTTGIYKLPSYSVTGRLKAVNIGDILDIKYIKKKDDCFGYYSGLTILNTLGICNQIPNTKEIVTNKESSRKRIVNICDYSVVLRKPETQINKSNAKILQFLDILKNIDEYRDVDKAIAKKFLAEYYGKDITINQIQKYIAYYPSKVSKKFMEYRIYELFAQK